MSRLTLPPVSPRQVREMIEPPRLASIACRTMLETSTRRPALRPSRCHVLPPERTVMGPLSRATRSVSSFVRAAAACRPPTGTPAIRTPFAITSRREWS